MPQLPRPDENNLLFDYRRLPIAERRIIAALIRALREKYELDNRDNGLPDGVIAFRRAP